MAGVTNRGKFNILNHVFRGVTLPSNYYIFLVSDTPTEDTDTLGQLTEVNVAAGEVALPTGGSDGIASFDTITETDSSTDNAIIQIKNCVFAGPIVAATHAVMVDGTTTGDDVWAFWSLGGATTVSTGQNLTLQDLQINLQES